MGQAALSGSTAPVVPTESSSNSPGGSPQRRGPTELPPQAIEIVAARGYDIAEELDRGGAENHSGVVLYIARRRADRSSVVLKCMPPTSTWRTEGTIMQAIRHPNVARCYDVIDCQPSGWSVIVVEYCSGGDLLNLVNLNYGFSERQARRYFVQVASALAACHERRIAHRDVKLENVLLRADGTLALCDFEMAAFYNERECIMSTCGTINYAAPELLRATTQACVLPEAADVWALGVLLYALVACRLPFDTGHVDGTRMRVLAGCFIECPKFSPPLNELLQAMFRSDARLRPTLEQVLEHRWVRQTGEP
jgi:serine/threonine protein kinase